MSTETTFRIGGWYRRMDNEVVLLGPMDDCNKWYWDAKEPIRSFGAAYRNGDELDAVGYICLQSGRYCAAISEAFHSRHLLPGELHQVNGSWVPVEEKPAKSIEFTTALHPITKKVVPVAISYGPGYEALHFTVDLGRPVRTSIAEPKREPLTWNKPVKVDRFPGFTSTYDGPVIANEGEGLGVQRISPIDRDPKNGSAFLKEMKG